MLHSRPRSKGTDSHSFTTNSSPLCTSIWRDEGGFSMVCVCKPAPLYRDPLLPLRYQIVLPPISSFEGVLQRNRSASGSAQKKREVSEHMFYEALANNAKMSSFALMFSIRKLLKIPLFLGGWPAGCKVILLSSMYLHLFQGLVANLRDVRHSKIH